MAYWAGLGHAIRDRQGLPSNHLEAMESPVASKYETVDQAAQAHAAAGSAKIPVGLTNLAQPTPRGTRVPRKNTQSADPTAGGKANRTNIERNGAAYRITANIAPSHDPVAGPTMQSARILPSVHGRTASFRDPGNL